MGNKSVSTGVDDTRGTPQGAHPFCRGHQGQGSFHSLPLLLSDQGEAPTPYRHQVTLRFPAACTQIPWKTTRNVNIRFTSQHSTLISDNQYKGKIQFWHCRHLSLSSFKVSRGTRRRKIKGWRGVLKQRWYQVFSWDLCWEGRMRISELLMKTSLPAEKSGLTFTLIRACAKHSHIK